MPFLKNLGVFICEKVFFFSAVLFLIFSCYKSIFTQTNTVLYPVHRFVAIHILPEILGK